MAFSLVLLLQGLRGLAKYTSRLVPTDVGAIAGRGRRQPGSGPELRLAPLEEPLPERGTNPKPSLDRGVSGGAAWRSFDRGLDAHGFSS